MGHHAPGVGAGIDCQRHEEHQSHHEPMHHLPRVEGDGELLANPVAGRHGRQYNNVERRQEDAEVLLGREPQTDVAEALEGAAEFEVARNEADGTDHRQSPLAEVTTEQP